MHRKLISRDLVDTTWDGLDRATIKLELYEMKMILEQTTNITWILSPVNTLLACACLNLMH